MVRLRPTKFSGRVPPKAAALRDPQGPARRSGAAAVRVLTSPPAHHSRLGAARESTTRELARSHASAAEFVQRAKIVLLLADGVPRERVA